MKLYFSGIKKRVALLTRDVLGPDSLRVVARWRPGSWSGDCLRPYASTIGG